MKIGFFDSGLGGLTVLKKAIEDYNLKGEIYYLGDTKNTPYGIKEESYVKEIINDNIKYLIDIGCNPIVVACNTATSLAIKDLRSKYKEITFIGTEPAVKVAADAHMNKRILVLATSITVRQEKLLNLVNSLNIQDSVELIAADKLVQFAEDINCINNTSEINDYIKSILEKYNLKEYSHIVLGCTHFPLFKDNFYDVVNKICPKSNIKVIDGSDGISKNLMKYVQNGEKISVNIIMTSKSESFKIRAEQILNIDNIGFEYKLQ